MESDPVGREFLCVWDEPYRGPRTLLVRALDADAVRRRFPGPDVIPVDLQSVSAPEVLERMRYAAGPFQDPIAPVQARTETERSQFLMSRKKYRESLRQSRLRAGDSAESLDDLVRLPFWVDIDDEPSIRLATRNMPDV